VQRLLEAAESTHVVYLAAQSFVGSSWHTSAETLSTNIEGSGEPGRRHSQAYGRAAVLAIRTSEEYGLAYQGELPIEETNPLRPLSPYAVNRVADDLTSYPRAARWRRRSEGNTDPHQIPSQIRLGNGIVMIRDDETVENTDRRGQLVVPGPSAG
jgi:GDP-mannose 4,6 dehydratase